MTILKVLLGVIVILGISYTISVAMDKIADMREVRKL